ncbi:hypothetical protein FRB96_008221 [Tulasnella sp. 330]|nr:hypothetical protein FRB96_008221 [Tulasnella sp. 330]
MTGAAFRVLEIPELVHNILDLADQRTRAVAARTRRAWNPSSLDKLWRSMESLAPVLQLLGDLRSIAEIGHPEKWVLSLDDSDWTRFKIYASRIRELRCSDAAMINGKCLLIAPSVFNQVALYRPSHEALLPNLKSLHWTGITHDSAPAVLMLVSPSIEVLRISFKQHTTADVQVTLFKHLYGRLSGIVDLGIASPFRSHDITRAVARCLQSMPKLAELSLPQYYLYDAILRALGPSISLRVLITDYHTPSLYDNDGMHFYSEEGWFSSLESITINASPRSFTSFLSLSPRPKLQSVRLSTRRLANPSELRHLCSILADSCPAVLALAFVLYSDDDAQSQPIIFDDIRPLLACSQLESLEITHDYPMTLNDAEIEEMGAAWQGMGNLDLCSEPYIEKVTNETPGTPIAVLATMARVMPALTYLGLYFSPESIPTISRSGPVPQQFLTLETISVGTSNGPALEEENMAVFLGVMCPSIQIESFALVWYKTGNPLRFADLARKATQHSGSWARVQKLVWMMDLCATVVQRRNKSRLEDNRAP